MQHWNTAQINRRALKGIEETGEIAEAYLSYSSSHNYKSKTPEDIQEEAIDALIIMLDIIAKIVPDDELSLVLDINYKPISDGNWVETQSLENSINVLVNCFSKVLTIYNNPITSAIGIDSIHLNVGLNAALAIAETLPFSDETFHRKIAKWTKSILQREEIHADA